MIGFFMISVVICSALPEKFAAASRMYKRLLSSSSFEIVHIKDATGLAEGYNRGLRQSRGDLVVFSHDDVEFLASDFSNRLTSHMDSCDVLGVMGTRRLSTANWWIGSGIPYGYGQMAYRNSSTGKFDVVIWSVPTRRVDKIQAMDGMFLCARRSVVEKLRFDESVFKRFHLYDTDFTFRAHLAGYRCAVATDLHIIHGSGGNHDQQWEEDGRRFVELYGAHLAPVIRRPFRTSSVAVDTVQELIEVMTPPHWSDIPASDSGKGGLRKRLKRLFRG